MALFAELRARMGRLTDRAWPHWACRAAAASRERRLRQKVNARAGVQPLQNAGRGTPTLPGMANKLLNWTARGLKQSLGSSRRRRPIRRSAVKTYGGGIIGPSRFQPVLSRQGGGAPVSPQGQGVTWQATPRCFIAEQSASAALFAL